MKKAFTLVEMLIVVIIIGILMSALLPRLKGAQERARDTARKANLSQISTALEMYFNDNGNYPNPTNKCAADLKSSLVPQYLSDIPSDPQKGRTTYGTQNGGCGSGSYAYTSLYRNGAENAGAVLVANVEAEGRVGNFILPGDGTVVAFDNTKTDNKRCGTDITSIGTTCSLTDATNNYFRSAQEAENAICQTTKVNTAENAAGCWGPKSLTDGQAKSNQGMVYARLN